VCFIYLSSSPPSPPPPPLALFADAFSSPSAVCKRAIAGCSLTPVTTTTFYDPSSTAPSRSVLTTRNGKNAPDPVQNVGGNGPKTTKKTTRKTTKKTTAKKAIKK
jgi:hypothetical protein